MKTLIINALVNAITEFMADLSDDHPAHNNLWSIMNDKSNKLEGKASNFNKNVSKALTCQAHKWFGAASSRSMRIFSPEECTKITMEARNFLLKAEKMGVLDRLTLEEVLDAVMVIEVKRIDREQLQWIVFAVLASKVLKKKAANSFVHY